MVSKVTKLLPMALLVSYAVKTLLKGPSLEDALVLAIFASFIAFIEYKTSEQRLNEIKNDFKSNINVLETHVKELEVRLKDVSTSHSELKSFTQAMNLSSQFNKIAPRNRVP